jgi:hypothetical protein
MSVGPLSETPMLSLNIWCSYMESPGENGVDELPLKLLEEVSLHHSLTPEVIELTVHRSHLLIVLVEGYLQLWDLSEEFNKAVPVWSEEMEHLYPVQLH